MREKASCDFYENKNWDEITTLINVPELEKLLKLSKYNKDKSDKLLTGFTKGFDIGYEGRTDRSDRANNLPLNNVGTKTDLWNKVMEVKLARYAGPFKLDDLPFDKYIQSPIGLVPKAGRETRLIFHLSYNFDNGNSSLNADTPKDKCWVKYRDLDHAVKNCLLLLEKANEIAEEGMVAVIFYSKADLKSAFRILPILVIQRKWLLMMAENPITGEKLYFIEKCLPFGASISCALFQEFSDALQHITEFLIKRKNRITNYLDDFLFIAWMRAECNKIMQKFLEVCRTINCPVLKEKCEPASDLMVFLGVLLNGWLHCLCIPEEKRLKVVNQLKYITSKKKATVKEIQQLTGILNFLQRAIVPGRAFTRRLYTRLSFKNNKGKQLKEHHHVYFKNDCKVWLSFLESETSNTAPFADLSLI